MEQSTSEEDVHSCFTELEIEVSQILLDLEYIISKSEYTGCWPLMWGGKKRLVWGVTKKRSSIDSSGICAANFETLSATPAEKSVQNEGEVKTCAQVKVQATSPSTPLAFSPSTESDDKSKHCHRKSSKKRSREELLKTKQELTDNRIALQGELERVKSFYNEVLAYNRDLKAMKKLVESSMICREREEPKLEINQSYSLGLSLGHSYQISVVPVAHHQQPSTADPRAAELLLKTREQFHHHHHHHQQFSYGQITPPLFSSNGGLCRVVNHVGRYSSSIPDINVAAEEICRMDSFEPLDYSRARAFADQRARYAEARRERQMKRKFKQPRK